jgi:ribosome-binding ATPase
MKLNCGIVGLPNVGKSTIFQALTAAPAEAANYPFCTIEPNVGIVSVKDKRLEQIAQIVSPEKTIPAVVEIVDIAGLVKGASRGEGLGNQFLGNIKQVGAIIHVVRCFEDDDIVHVSGRIDPIEDIETINIELAFKDLDTVVKKLEQLSKMLKSQDKSVKTLALQLDPLLNRLKSHFEEGLAARTLELSDDELEILKDLHLITLKDQIFLCNVDEDALENSNEHVEKVKEFANKEKCKVIQLCGKIESELASIEDDEERTEFMESLGIKESALNKLVSEAYNILGLRTYFTAGEKEVRAWTYSNGAKAPEAAGVIHTDFERGFIKAEVYHYDDLLNFGNESKVKESGKLRIEGKEYIVKDGDIIHFRFNV